MEKENNRSQRDTRLRISYVWGRKEMRGEKKYLWVTIFILIFSLLKGEPEKPRRDKKE